MSWFISISLPDLFLAAVGFTECVVVDVVAVVVVVVVAVVVVVVVEDADRSRNGISSPSGTKCARSSWVINSARPSFFVVAVAVVVVVVVVASDPFFRSFEYFHSRPLHDGIDFPIFNDGSRSGRVHFEIPSALSTYRVLPSCSFDPQLGVT